MAKGRRPAEADADQTDSLTPAVHRLADELHVLREVLDEIRGVFRWAVQNDKLRCPGNERSSDPPAEHDDEPRSASDEQPPTAATEAIQDCLRDVGEQLAEVVRDELRQQLADLRDAVDQFSLDIQWAARQVRSAVSERPTGCDHTPEDHAPIDDSGPVNDPKPTPEPADSGTKNTVAAGRRQSFLWQPE